jgi:hypothetical protein
VLAPTSGPGKSSLPPAMLSQSNNDLACKGRISAINFWHLAATPEEEVVVADHILSTAFLVTCTVATGVRLVYIFSKQWRN